jgi:hypothetical protein
MKKKNLFFSTAIFLLFVFISFSCKKEGDVGPAGAPSSEIKTSKEGFIKGEATGVRLDGAAYSYNLDFEGQYFETSNSYSVSPWFTTISISKVYVGDGDPFNTYSSVSFFFMVDSLADLSSPSIFWYSVSMEKDLGNNTYHTVNFDNTTAGASCTVSALSYDSNTGIITGDYTLSLPADGTHGSFSITNGTFSTKLVESSF